MRTTRIALLLAVVALAGAAEAARPAMPIDPLRYEAAEEDAGIVEAIDFDGPRIRVNGTTYFFEPGAYVELRGSPGAPSLIQRGINVYLRYLSIAGKYRVIYLRQEADNAATLAR